MDEYIKMQLSPEPEPVPASYTCSGKQEGMERPTSLVNKDPFDALDIEGVIHEHSVENIYERIQ